VPEGRSRGASGLPARQLKRGERGSVPASAFARRAMRDRRCREIFLNVGLWSADATKNTKTYFVW